MLWIVITGALLVGGAIGFFLGPTIKTFFGADFEPAPKDPASVENALMNRSPTPVNDGRPMTGYARRSPIGVAADV